MKQRKLVGIDPHNTQIVVVRVQNSHLLQHLHELVAFRILVVSERYQVNVVARI